MKITAEMLAGVLGGRVEGDPQTEVSTFAKIEEGTPGALSFLANPKYEQYLYTTQSSIVIVAEDLKLQQPVGATLVRVENPYAGFAKLLEIYESTIARPTGISDKAHIDPEAKVGEGCYIGPFAVIEKGAEVGDGSLIYPHAYVGKGVKIGKGCTLHPRAVVYHDCRLGDGVVLHSGVVIGADGFGFAPGANGYEKIPQIGIVTIEDDVEIGANACVDRSTMGSTYVRRGVKLDNLVQVAHNCEVGSHTVMSAQVGVAGSTKIGEWCMFGGQVGITGHAVIGDKVYCGAQAGIAGSIKNGNVRIQGSPAIDAKNFARSSAVFKNLPDMYTQFNRMVKEMAQMKEALEKLQNQ
jgi:UDP-3-O-[3-hydroxymyristoyl] glucosamine N-acyltransferase